MSRAPFSRKMQGSAWEFGDKMDVDWHIISYETTRGLGHGSGAKIPEEILSQYCMVEVDPNFPKKVKSGDFIVGGRNFGYGHDHDNSCQAILGVGVPAVICESSNGNFIRNSIHHGLPIVEVPGITQMVKEGDTLEVDLEAGVVKNLSSEEELHFNPYPEAILQILGTGGLYSQLQKQLKG